jgi:hypothetical protein
MIPALLAACVRGTGDPALAQRVECLLELRELLLRVCGLGIVRISQVSHEAFEP